MSKEQGRIRANWSSGSPVMEMCEDGESYVPMDAKLDLGALRAVLYSDRITRRARAEMLGELLRAGDSAAMTLVSTALVEAHGCVAEAARSKLWVSTRTLWRWISHVPGLKAVRQGAIDAKEDGR